MARFETNELAAKDDLAASAQYWVGDYYWRQENFPKAEENYQKVFLKWTNSMLAYQAYMMAGRAAMERASPADAIAYFTNLTATLSLSNSPCPRELALQAEFARGDATMTLPSDTNPNESQGCGDDILRDSKPGTRTIRLRRWRGGRVGNCNSAMAEARPRRDMTWRLRVIRRCWTRIWRTLRRGAWRNAESRIVWRGRRGWR